MLTAVLRLVPADLAAAETGPPPGWDLPARMAVATGLVLTLTRFAPVLGPRLAGLLGTFPVFAATLTVFAHHLEGAAAAARVLRGLLVGLFAFASFFFVLAALLTRVGLTAAFVAAAAAALALQVGSLHLVRSPARRPPG